jgi:hypothetical protein
MYDRIDCTSALHTHRLTGQTIFRCAVVIGLCCGLLTAVAA